MFSSGEISIKRLLSICVFLNVTFEILLKIVSDFDYVTHYMNDEQEEFLSLNWEYFCFYWKLLIEKNSVKKIQGEFELSDQRTEQLFLGLDKIGIIDYTGDQKYSLPNGIVLNFRSSGLMLKEMKERWKEDIVENTLNGKKPAGKFYQCFLKLTIPDHTCFENELTDILHEFMRKSQKIDHYRNLIGEKNNDLYPINSFLIAGVFRSTIHRLSLDPVLNSFKIIN